MDGPLAALKNRQIGNHAVPIMFREGGPIVPAMLDEVAAFQDQREALLRSLGRWPGRRGGFPRKSAAGIVPAQPAYSEAPGENGYTPP